MNISEKHCLRTFVLVIAVAEYNVADILQGGPSAAEELCVFYGISGFLRKPF